MRRLADLISSNRRILRTLGPADRDNIFEWMDTRPAASAFLYGWINRFGMPSHGRNAFFDVYVHGPDKDWDLVALVVNGVLVSFVEGEVAQAEELGALLRGYEYAVQTLVGPDVAVSAFAEYFTAREFEPRVNQAQCVMMRERSTPIEHIAYPPRLLTRATEEYAQRVIQASLDMHTEEVQRPNSQSDAVALRRASLQKIRAGRVWVLVDDAGELLFKASTSLPTPHIVQVEGVWTAPKARGQGIGRDCIAQICSTLHATFPLISLIVGRDNVPALRLYQSLGFAHVCDWRTMYLDAHQDVEE